MRSPCIWSAIRIKSPGNGLLIISSSPDCVILIAPSVGLFNANKILWILVTIPNSKKCS